MDPPGSSGHERTIPIFSQRVPSRTGPARPRQCWFTDALLTGFLPVSAAHPCSGRASWNHEPNERCASQSLPRDLLGRAAIYLFFLCSSLMDLKCLHHRGPSGWFIRPQVRSGQLRAESHWRHGPLPSPGRRGPGSCNPWVCSSPGAHWEDG